MPCTRHVKRIHILLPLVLALLLSACSRSARSEKQERQVFAMDTIMLLTAYGENAQAGLSAAEATILSLEAALDPEREDSELYALNHAEGAPVSVSDATLQILETGLTVWERSGGALDFTLYPAVRAWGFGGDGEYRVPDESELSALLALRGMEHIALDGHTVSLAAGQELSFGAAAKGCTAQAAVNAMRDAGVEAAILTLGGNVQTLGTKPDGSPWVVAVQDPFDTGSYLGTLSLDGGTAAVTSGNYQRYFEADGQIWHHILDPETGYPVRSGLCSVTVVCPDGTTADSLSTALFVLGEEDALAYRDRFGGFELVLVTEDRRVIVTGGLSFSEHGDFTYVYVD